MAKSDPPVTGSADREEDHDENSRHARIEHNTIVRSLGVISFLNESIIILYTYYSHPLTLSNSRCYDAPHHALHHCGNP
jgi:hypothetical protein